MNVLFAHSFFMDFDDKQKVVREPYPPLATLIAAAAARDQGHRVALFDAMPAQSTRDFQTVFAADSYDAVVFLRTISTGSPKCAWTACAKPVSK